MRRYGTLPEPARLAIRHMRSLGYAYWKIAAIMAISPSTAYRYGCDR